MNRIDRRIWLFRNATRRLQGLLDDPQPGLLTWMHAVDAVAFDIYRIAEGDFDFDPPRPRERK
jgi:hypothetical protein